MEMLNVLIQLRAVWLSRTRPQTVIKSDSPSPLGLHVAGTTLDEHMEGLASGQRGFLTAGPLVRPAFIRTQPTLEPWACSGLARLLDCRWTPQPSGPSIKRQLMGKLSLFTFH